MQFKKRALDGNLERILEKEIRVQLPLDQNLLDMLKVTTNSNNISFIKMDQIYLKGQNELDHTVLW